MPVAEGSASIDRELPESESAALAALAHTGLPRDGPASHESDAT